MKQCEETITIVSDLMKITLYISWIHGEGKQETVIYPCSLFGLSCQLIFSIPIWSLTHDANCSGGLSFIYILLMFTVLL